MPKIPRQLKPRQVIKVLERCGFYKYGVKGSHIHYKHQDGRRTQVAVHAKAIPQGTLKAILRQADLSTDDLLKNL